ncbi:hypothetical protein Tco_0829506 [Tanacetum coccineum]
MSLVNQKATTEYQEAIQATEDLESPAVGFAKTSDYKEMTSRRPSILNRSSTQTQTELPTQEEPLNKVRRSNKPKRSKQKCDTPPDITPIEEVVATGWGDEFSDDEVKVTLGKVTILEERNDWDDDERSGGKVLVIQERLAQNQQEFLDEYLPQWDENLAIQKKESELEWENPFAAKHGENHTILHLSKEEENDDLPYPKFRKFKQMAAQIIKKHEEHAFPSSSSQIESTQSYQPPHDSIMGPPVYPLAQHNPQPFYKPDYQFGYP